MSKEDKLYQNYLSTQQKLNELSIMKEKIDRNYQSLLNTMDFTPKQLNDFMENPENFSPEIWEELQKEKLKMEEMINLQLSVLRDPKKIQKKYNAQGRVKQNWIFVR